MRSMALRLPMSCADRSHNSAVIMKYAPFPPSFPPTVYSRARQETRAPFCLRCGANISRESVSFGGNLSSVTAHVPKDFFISLFLFICFVVFCCWCCCYCVARVTEVLQETQRRTCCSRVVIVFTHETIWEISRVILQRAPHSYARPLFGNCYCLKQQYLSNVTGKSRLSVSEMKWRGTATGHFHRCIKPVARTEASGGIGSLTT